MITIALAGVQPNDVVEIDVTLPHDFLATDFSVDAASRAFLINARCPAPGLPGEAIRIPAGQPFSMVIKNPTDRVLDFRASLDGELA